jgi:hypothetical protein
MKVVLYVKTVSGLPTTEQQLDLIYISHEKGGLSGARSFSLLTLSPLFLEAHQ